MFDIIVLFDYHMENKVDKYWKKKWKNQI